VAQKVDLTGRNWLVQLVLKPLPMYGFNLRLIRKKQKPATQKNELLVFFIQNYKIEKINRKFKIVITPANTKPTTVIHILLT
jgi:hypothetical protein